MSGIAGIYHFDGRPVDDEINRMMDMIEHRGPDDQAVWTSGPVGLGHCMLHTTPESLHASLPQESTRSGCVITADARLDNREEIIRDLKLSPGSDQVIPDSTLILRAYEKWGRDCVDHLLGAFSFVVWDPRERHLFSAKDHFGVRPLFYYHEPGQLFAFASEIKALLQIESVPQVPNQVRIAEHLMIPVEKDVTRTFYERIRRGAPGHALLVQPGSFEDNQYWALDPHRETRLSSDEEYAERFSSILRSAVDVRLRSASPVGSALSGGLDSSSVTCQAAQILEESAGDQSLHTYSAIFDDVRTSDERSYIKDVHNKYESLCPHFIVGDDKSPLAEWEELYQYVDGACSAGNVYISWRLYQLAQKQGVRVILDGYDGDTTISHGVGWLNQLREEGKWLRLMQEVGAYARTLGESPTGAVWSWIRGPLFSLPGLSHLIAARQALKSFAGQGNDGNPESSEPVWQRVLPEDVAGSIRPKLDEKSNSKPSTERAHHHQLLERPLMARSLDLRNHVGSRSSVEVRFPLYDKRLVEFCLSLPPDQKLRNGWSRRILRRSMEGTLPPSIQWRQDKSDLSPALHEGLLAHEQDLLGQLAQGEIGGIERFVSIDFLREAVPHYLSHLEGKSHENSGRENLIVWRALALALWLRYKESSPEPIG